MGWINSLETQQPILICKHVVQNPDLLTCVYHADDGTISMMCECQHDMEEGKDITWMHSGHLIDKFPHLASLPNVPQGSMGYYFKDFGQWAIEKIL